MYKYIFSYFSYKHKSIFCKVSASGPQILCTSVENDR